MATGDIISVEIGADGWWADVVLSGLGTGGTYSARLGLGANNDPASGSPALVFDVTSLGFNDTGIQTTVARTVYGTKAVRTPYGTNTVAGSYTAGAFLEGETVTQSGTGATAKIVIPGSSGPKLFIGQITGTPNSSGVWTGGTSTATFTPSAAPVDYSTGLREFFDGTNTRIRIALSDYIFEKDKAGSGNSGTDVQYTILAGFYTQGTANNAGTGTAVNNSTSSYPKVVGNWSWPGYQLMDSTSKLRCVAFHSSGQNGRPVRCVKFTVSDGSSSNSQTVTSPVYDSTVGDAVPVVEYVSSADLTTGLTQGAVLDINFIAYPWIGDSGSVLDTSAGTAAPTPLYGPIKGVCNRTGGYGLTKVLVGPGGNDATGQAYDSELFNEASASKCATIDGALAKALAFNSANRSRNDCGGVEVLLEDGSYLWTGGSSPYGDIPGTWTTITRASSSSGRSGVVITGGSGGVSGTGRSKIKDITITTSGVSVFSGCTALWLDQCTFNCTDTATVYQATNWWITHCSVNKFSQNLVPFSTSYSPLCLVRGTNFDNYSGQIFTYVLIGNIRTTGTGTLQYTEQSSGTVCPPATNAILAFNRLTCPATTNAAVAIGGAINNHGFAVVQNVFENTASSSSPLAGLAADGTVNDVNHGIVWHNVFVGQRLNIAYNDNGANAPTRRHWSVKNNLVGDWNIKSDTFAAQNANRVGNWPVLYGVGCSGNVMAENIAAASGSFLSEFPGLNSVMPTASGQPPGGGTNVDAYFAFVDDKSWHSGAATAGGGDYHLTESSPGVVLPKDYLLTFDLDGAARYAGDASGAYTYGSAPVTDAVVPWTINGRGGGALVNGGGRAIWVNGRLR